jgi:long-chain acyl-CoA synthetase
MAVGSPLTVVDAFERVARWFPNEEAVVDSASRLTFRGLDERSRRAASLLAALGARRGVPLAILAAPSVAYLVAWLGAVRLGAIPLALHIRESAPALARVCDKIRPNLLVYDGAMEALAEAIVAASPPLIATVRIESALDARPSPSMRPHASFNNDLAAAALEFPRHEPAENDPAIIVLSSGTSSVAKGVVHTHRGLVEMARTDLYLYGGLRPGDRSLVPLSTAFIGCYNGWFPFLNAGACTVFMERFDLDALARRVKDERISHVFLTPTLWRRLMDSDLAGADFRSVRLAGFAAEVMDAATLKRLRATITPNVVQMYGSTETGAAAACNFADDMVGDRLVSVGRPMLNGDLRVVTPGGGPTDEVPIGEVGEILVASPSLASGIWDDPEMSRGIFIDDGRRRWWRSRDLGRIDAAGFLFIEGRHDDMIISAGINIMPARVEEVLLSHRSVRECAVIGVPHAELGEQVQAFVVSDDVKLDGAALDRHVMASDLSAYQRPRIYTFVTELPRTPTNKISRKTLRDRAAASTNPPTVATGEK